MRQRRRLLSAVSLVAALGLVAAACGDDDDSSSGATTTAAGEATTTAAGGATTTAAGGATTTAGEEGACKPGTVNNPEIETLEADGAGKSVGLLFDVTGRGDKSFNDAAAAAVDRATADFGITSEESTPTSTTGGGDRPERMNAFVGKHDLVVANGFLWGDATTAAATANPDQDFAIIDSVVFSVGADGKATTTPAPNVRSMTFAEHEGSALVGAAAACASKTGKIGFIGGVEQDLIKKFEAGYAAGAKAVNPDIEISNVYITQPPDFTGFNDPAKGKAIASQMINEDIDVIYAAAGGSGKGVFTAAVESGKEPGELYVIGVDSDQYQSASDAEKPFILTSMLKGVEKAVYEAIAAQLNGELKGEVFVNDLKSGGVGYSGSNKDIEKYAGTVEEVKQKILDGDIQVPDKP